MEIKSYCRTNIGSYEIGFAQPDVIHINPYQVVEVKPFVYSGVETAKSFVMTDNDILTKNAERQPVYVVTLAVVREQLFINEKDFKKLTQTLNKIAS